MLVYAHWKHDGNKFTQGFKTIEAAANWLIPVIEDQVGPIDPTEEAPGAHVDVLASIKKCRAAHKKASSSIEDIRAMIEAYEEYLHQYGRGRSIMHSLTDVPVLAHNLNPEQPITPW